MECVLGQLLFCIYMNNLVDNVVIVSKFADDTKIFWTVESLQELRLQELDQLGSWAKEWQMEFNLDKRKTLQFSMSNHGRIYTMVGPWRIFNNRDL